MHDALDGIGRGEALVEHLVFVLKVAGVILEVVLLATEESINFDLPGGVERLALGLGAVTDVVLVAEILVRVSHVLAGVNVEVLLLLIVDLEEVGLSRISILTEVSLHDGTVHSGSLLHESTLVDVGESEARKELSAELHTLEGTDSADGLEAEVKTDTPGHDVVTSHGAVH